MKRRMILSILAALAILSVGLGSGCNGEFADFLDYRHPANEAMKQQADLNYRAANQTYATGLPPQTPAAKQMAEAAATQLLDTGYPKKPLDISDYFPPAITQAWQNKIQQVERLKLKEQLSATNMELLNQYLAKLIGEFDLIPDKNGTLVTIDAKALIPRLQAIADATVICGKLSQEITVPDDLSLSQEEQRRMKKLDDMILALDAAAKARAAVKPTKVEVAERFVDKAADFVTENPALTTALAGVPGGGLILGWLNGRRKQRKAAAEIQQRQQEDAEYDNELAAAKHDAQRLAQERSFLQDALNTERGKADSLAGVVSQQAQQLAAVIPAVPLAAVHVAPHEGVQA